MEIPDGMSPELLVVDNGSSDGTKTLVESVRHLAFDIIYAFEAGGGKAAALNTGLKLARGELFVFTDDDIEPSTGWLHNLTEPIIDGRCDAVCGRVRLAPHLTRPWMSITHAGWLAATDYLDPEHPETAVGANMAFHRRVFDHVPAFDPELGPGRLGLWEDTLFSAQVVRSGFKLTMAPRAEVIHHFEPSRLTRAGFLSRAKAEGRSSAYVAWHWRHEAPPRGSRTLLELYGRLFAKRILYWRAWRAAEGMPEWEMNLLTGIEFEKQLRRESRRQRAYDKGGTRKISV